MRFRFAPSPTGYLHIGNVRTAIYNYLISKKYNASFVLRIEDTDMERSSRESEQSILDDLKWLGIEWNEGPDVGGDFGPYRQSERFNIYKEYTERLIRDGKAYYCYCTQEELDIMRRESLLRNDDPVYQGRCRELSNNEKKKFEAEGRKPSVRFRLPKEETIIINDIIKGRVLFDSENIGGDFIITRPDGIPVYNYIVTIDDALMKISHVIRGEDHLSNTPKQMLIAHALNLPIPRYAHHALVLGPDKSKLSKRHGITSVNMYRRNGYLPEAIVNYLAILGWTSKSGEEIMPIDEIIKEIDIEDLSNKPAVFDFQKLKWINGHYIRNSPLNDITELSLPFIMDEGYCLDETDKDWLQKVISLLQGKCDLLSDISNLAGIFLKDVQEPDEEADELLNQEESKIIIEKLYTIISDDLDMNNFANDLINRIKENTSIKGKKLFMPLRAVLTGKLKGPELDKAIELIGFAKSKERISYFYDKYANK
ncbi:MAG: glutamate--tRNA ligase [Spirochaetota bacterium]|nr:glutamate--tRNA ligase [Spirochaetota bacterium]